MVALINARSSTTSGSPLRNYPRSPREDRRSPRGRAGSAWPPSGGKLRLPPRLYLFTDPRWGCARFAWRGEGTQRAMSKNTKSDGPHFLRYPRVVHTTWESFWATCASFAFIYRLRSPTGGASPPSPREARARARPRPYAPLVSSSFGAPSRAFVRKLIEEGKEEKNLHKGYLRITMPILSLSICRGAPFRGLSRNRGAYPWHAAEINVNFYVYLSVKEVSFMKSVTSFI